MDSTLIIIMKLYGPMVLCAILLISSFTLKSDPKNPAKITASFPGIISLGIPVSNMKVATLLSLMAAFSVLGTYLVYDYSSFFPSEVSMSVFYDRDGIESCLETFEPTQLKSLGIPEDYARYQQVYYSDLDRELSALISSRPFFCDQKGLIHSEGYTIFKVAQVDGLQKYIIQESHGELSHTLEEAGKADITFMSFFEKIESKHDFLSPTLYDIFVRHEIVLQPIFKQIIAENVKSTGVTFHHTLYGVTKITFFPFPEYGNTLYLFESKDKMLIPIGYAKYHKST